MNKDSHSAQTLYYIILPSYKNFAQSNVKSYMGFHIKGF